MKSGPIVSVAPGPGAYNTIMDTGKNASKFTMRLKTAAPTDNVTAKIVPGPGQYPIPPSINSTGRYADAKHKSSGAVLFNPPCSKRFHELRK